jgi:PAS domain S-box-containing protein
MAMEDSDQRSRVAGRMGESRARDAATARVRVLVVDDDAGGRRAIERLLRDEGYLTSTAADGVAAVEEALRQLPDVVLTDLHMEAMHGIELCQRLHALDPELPVIVMTAHSDMGAVMESLRVGAEDYLIKPLDGDAVLWCVKRAVARRVAKREHEDLQRTLNQRLVLSSVREKELAEAEARQRAQLNALLENLSEGVTIADPSGRVLMINDAARAILGLGDVDIDSLESLHARSIQDVASVSVPRDARPMVRALRGEQFTDYEAQWTRPSGEPRRISCTGSCVRDESGGVALAIVVFRDVTDLRRLEQQRDEYLALITHDLRNPLNNILLSISTLKESVSERGLVHDVKRAERAELNVSRMTGMLEELREATTLELQGAELHRRRCDLHKVVVSAVDALDEASALRVTIETDDALPHTVFADPAGMERVVANLLGNALKYSKEDAPVVARIARAENGISLDIVDRGIGIAPETIRTLFDRYTRTTAGREHASGLGLGLYIARLIVDAHGGRIGVSNNAGEGSTFRLVLPATRVTETVAASAAFGSALAGM